MGSSDIYRDMGAHNCLQFWNVEQDVLYSVLAYKTAG